VKKETSGWRISRPRNGETGAGCGAVVVADMSNLLLLVLIHCTL